MVQEAAESKVSVVKTNIFIDDPVPYIYMPGFGQQNPNPVGTYMSLQTRDRLLGWLKSLRANLPESIEVALDIL